MSLVDVPKSVILFDVCGIWRDAAGLADSRPYFGVISDAPEPTEGDLDSLSFSSRTIASLDLAHEIDASMARIIRSSQPRQECAGLEGRSAMQMPVRAH